MRGYKRRPKRTDSAGKRRASWRGAEVKRSGYGSEKLTVRFLCPQNACSSCLCSAATYLHNRHNVPAKGGKGTTMIHTYTTGTMSLPRKGGGTTSA